jgi:hypothetical protein
LCGVADAESAHHSADSTLGCGSFRCHAAHAF